MDSISSLAADLPSVDPNHPPASARHLQTSPPAPEPISRATSRDERSSVQSSIEEVWYLKQIPFSPEPGGETKRYRIITQNYNGPCSFIAICNILILRGQLTIEPPDRPSVSYEFLSQLLAEHLLSLQNMPEADISAALSMMPLTTKGMDLNPLFTGPTSFRPATTGGELALFASAGIPLVHGWLVDPDAPEYPAVARAADYDTALNLIVEADVLTQGRLVVAEGADESGAAGAGSGGSSSSSSGPGTGLSEEDRRKVEDALAVRAFLDATRSQLTYHGLFTLASLTLPPPPTSSTPYHTGSPPQLLALFRNAHLSVLYKHPSGALYALATDEAFLREPTVVWERLEDVDQRAAVFVDGAFQTSSPVGGDWAGWTPEQELGGPVDPSDHALARQLQAEEDALAQQAYARRQQQREQRDEVQRRAWERQRQEEEERDAARARKKKEKGDCVVM